MQIKKIKTIRSHTGVARFLAECDKSYIREIPRVVKEPYCHSQTQCAYLYKNKEVIVAETKHRYYEVFEIS